MRCGLLLSLLLVWVVPPQPAAGETACPVNCECSTRWQRLAKVQCTNVADLPELLSNLARAWEAAEAEVEGSGESEPLVIDKLTIRNLLVNQIKEDDFSQLQFRQLDLSDNALENVGPPRNFIAADAFASQAGSLRSLVLANNSLTEWPTLQNYSELISVDLSGNELTDIPVGVFDATPLRYLKLARNKICSMERNALDEVRPWLELLDLSGNCLFAVPAQNLRNAGRLSLIDLSANRLTQIGNMQFMNLPQLKQVYLSGNRITELRPLAFMNVPELQQLHLDNNYINALEPNRFQQFARLELLNLSHNELDRLVSSTFVGMPNLRVLALDHNQVHSIETLAVSSCPRLQVLSITNNNVSTIYRNAFDQCPQLSAFHLSNNSLEHLDRGMLEGMRNLQQLRLDHNRLQRLSPDTFTATPLLTTLDLSSNGLASLPAHAFASLRRLFWLDLSHNRLQSLEQHSFPPKIATIILHGNEFVCDVSFDWFIGYLVDNNVRTFLPGQSDVVCTAPDSRAGVRFKELMIEHANRTLHNALKEIPLVTDEATIIDILPDWVHRITPARPAPGRPPPAPGRPATGGAGFTLSPSQPTPQQAALPTHINIPGMPTIDLTKVPPSLIKHVLSGGQVPGIPQQALDAFVAEYRRRAQQGTSAVATATPAIPPEILRDILSAHAQSTTAGQLATSTPSQQAAVPQQSDVDPGPVPPAIIDGISLEEMFRRLPPNFDLGRLPPELLQQVAMGQPLDLALMPSDILEAFVRHNPDLADRINLALKLHQQRMREAALRPRPPPIARHGGGDAQHQSAAATRTPYDIAVIDRNTVDLSKPDERSGQQQRAWRITLVGLVSIGAVSALVIVFLCCRRLMHTTGSSNAVDANVVVPSTGQRHSSKLTAAHDKYSMATASKPAHQFRPMSNTTAAAGGSSSRDSTLARTARPPVPAPRAPPKQHQQQQPYAPPHATALFDPYSTRGTAQQQQHGWR